MKKRTSKNPAPKSAKRPAKDAKPAVESAAKPSPFLRDPRLPAAGETITKTYKARKLTVKVTGAGLEYEGKPYRSLSAIAREILGGAQVNGFLWFGLARREGEAPKAAKAKAEKPAKKGAAKRGEKPAANNDLGDDAGQRRAQVEAGIAKPPKAAAGPAAKP